MSAIKPPMERLLFWKNNFKAHYRKLKNVFWIDLVFFVIATLPARWYSIRDIVFPCGALLIVGALITVRRLLLSQEAMEQMHNELVVLYPEFHEERLRLHKENPNLVVTDPLEQLYDALVAITE